MRTLLSSYKSAKDNSRQTGASPCNPPFMDQMEEIFGDKPIICNSHTLQLGHGPITALREQNQVTATVEISNDEQPRRSKTSDSSKGKKRKTALQQYLE